MLLGPEEIEIRDVPVPRPGAGEILLKVEAATTCGTDVKVFRRGGHPRMLKAPTLFGHEMAGRVAALGAGVEGYQVGDAIVVANSAPCLQCEPCRRGRENLCEDLHYLNGAFAEYLLVPRRFRGAEHPSHSGRAVVRAGRAGRAARLRAARHRCLRAGEIRCVRTGRGSYLWRRPDWTFVRRGARQPGTPAGPRGSQPRPPRGRARDRRVADDRDRARWRASRQRCAKKVAAERASGLLSIAPAQPGVWSDAIEFVRPGGLVNLFGGCAPGTTIPLDTHLVHYSELTLKGVYHHRPDTFRRAIALLADPSFRAGLLISRHSPDKRCRRGAAEHDPQGSAEGRHPQLARRDDVAHSARRYAQSPASRRSPIFCP